MDSKDVDNDIIQSLIKLDCLIIDNFSNNIDEKLLYSILNQSKQLDNYLVINSNESLKNINFELKDLSSRVNSFLYIGIELPDDDLLKVIISEHYLTNR